jgi:hypothetical protein
VAVIEGQALNAELREVRRRVARHHGAIVVDLGDPSGGAVEVTAGGWRMVARSPIPFVRTTGLSMPMPVPVAGGRLDALRALVNVADELDWWLVVAWMIHALMVDQALTILRVQGEQGACKSTTARLLVRLVDPSTSILRSEPPNRREWAVTASGSRAFVLDNLSWLPPWFSDALCRASTGEAVVHRALYSDADISVLHVQRVMVITTIGMTAIAGDLAERILPIDVTAPTEEARLGDDEVEARFVAAWPELLGALFDWTARVLAELEHLTLERLPRMADFGRVCAAVGRLVDPEHPDAVLDRYRTLSEDLMLEVVEGSPVSEAIVALVDARPVELVDDTRVKQWTGTATELLAQLNLRAPFLSFRPKGWPRTATAMGSQVRRLAPSLRHRGIDVDQHHADHGRVRSITLVRRLEGDAGDAGDTSTYTPLHADEEEKPGTDEAQKHSSRGVERHKGRPVTRVTPVTPPVNGDDNQHRPRRTARDLL